ncbi:HAMP domain-containing histidine kinase [Patescibacteria group bacterium]|nr:HAMP domain-containing histidine kinase [Patescibacteria group bacterium]
MIIRKFLKHLNILAQSRESGVSIWQYPQFLFLVMGIMTIVSILTAYVIGIRYVAEPEVVVLIVLILSAILLVITFTITQSFERLIEANRMKSEFVSIVSHQLRSPLSNLKWALELLMSGRLGKIEAQQLEYFGILKDSSARMRELVRDLLIVSRIEQGKLPLQTVEVSLPLLVKDLILEFTPLAEASNVVIKFEPDNSLPNVLADPSKVKLVVENFLDNAIRYIKGNGEVGIKLSREDNFLHFQIRDNGVGIPKEDQKYIFKKFFRSSNVLKRQTQGTGLGLYIAKSIIERSKGKIWFKSEEDKGTTLHFILPIK